MVSEINTVYLGPDCAWRSMQTDHFTWLVSHAILREDHWQN